ncbi:MAG: tetratricopeptide repeat protein, partial [Acidobacteriota bacterium]|nr:tetratricopeptide repeat protein [Acidobacteriota bacterium]
MSRKKLSFSGYIFFLSILALLCGAQFLFPTATAGALQRATGRGETAEPIALIKSITVNHDQKMEPEVSEVKVKHSNQTEEAGRANMPLYKDDEVTTGPTAQVAILFLDNPQVKDNEVLLDVDTVVRIGSIFTRIGRVLIRVKGLFDTRTERVKLGVQGTEYELTVARDGTNTIKVLKGGVSITSGSFAKNFSDTAPTSALPLFLRTAFAEQEPLTQQKEMEFVVVSGQVSNIEREFIFTNHCQRKHVFQIRGPRNLDWFQMLGGDQFSVDAQASRTIKFAFRADGTGVPIGTQENEIVARCLDCNQEPSCELGGLLVPITIKVISSGQPGAPPLPTDEPLASGPQSALAIKQEQVTVPPAGRLIKTNASPEQLQQTLNWSDDLILEGQPTYAAQSVVPHFRTWEERDSAFRQARRDSILNNDRNSNDVLAQVYVDWGNGAKAEQELRESALTAADPERLTTLAEAYRLMGRLDEADTALKRALAIDPMRARTLNTLGNVYLDRARAAQEIKNFTLAMDYLDRASAAYTKAARRPGVQHHLQPSQSPANQANVQTVVRSNLGQVHLKLGEMARQQGNAPEALAQYRTATRTFQDAAALDHDNPFAFAGIGDAYREAAEVFVSRNEKANADQYFAMSKDHYVQAANLHGDMSEAYVGLGRIADDTGQRGEAIKYFARAAALRPEQPEPHYYLAVVYAGVDPEKAAEEARTYLRVERPVFNQGQQANNATRIKDGLQPEKLAPLPKPTEGPQPPVVVVLPPVTPPT